jgi:hypothetical protein
MLNTASGIGYVPGRGGAITQETSKSTSVTLNKPCGVITMHNAELGAGASVAFALLNNLVTSNDLVIAHPGGAVAASYTVNVIAVSTGTSERL